MPRHPKPARLRANTERVDVGILGPGDTEPSPAPPPPDDLLPVTLAAWEAYWASPIARLVTTATDLMALRRLFRFYDEQELAMQAYRRRRTVAGSTGQRRLNPVLGAIEPADILALEDRYGLNPRARLALGVILGDAARSLADLNADLDGSGAGDDEPPDPRIIVLDRYPR